MYHGRGKRVQVSHAGRTVVMAHLARPGSSDARSRGNLFSKGEAAGASRPRSFHAPRRSREAIY